jgi:hypothetical protein
VRHSRYWTSVCQDVQISMKTDGEHALDPQSLLVSCARPDCTAPNGKHLFTPITEREYTRRGKSRTITRVKL